MLSARAFVLSASLNSGCDIVNFPQRLKCHRFRLINNMLSLYDKIDNAFRYLSMFNPKIDLLQE